MPTPHAFKTILLATLLLAQTTPLRAQVISDPHQYDAQIATLLKKEEGDSALSLLNKKASLAKQVDSLALWGQTQVDIVDLFEDDSKKALSYLEDAWAKRWREPRNAQEWKPFMIIQVNRGWFLSKMGKIWQSLQAYEHASQLYEKFKYPDFDAVRFFYKAYGNNYVRLGDNDKAIAVFQKALACKTTNETLCGLYCDIGIAYWNKGAYSSAEENYQKGLSLSDISDVRRGFLLGRLAETMLDLGRTAEAARTANQALHILRPEGPDDTRTLEFRARARRILGLANTRLGKFAEAERLLTGALADDRASSGDTSREVGKDYIAFSNLYLQKGKALQALQAADLALASVIPSFKPNSATPSSFAPARPRLPRPGGQEGLAGGMASADKQITKSPNPQATQFYEENTIFEALSAKATAAQILFEKTSDPRWLELALDCHQLAWQAESILRKVFQYSSSKLNLQKDARAREEAAMNVARLLFEKTGQSIWLEKAFAIAERSKAALLLEALQDNLVRQRLSGSDQRFGELTALRQNLSYFDKNQLLHPNSDKVPQWRIEADGIRDRIATLEQTLRKEYPSLSIFETSTANWLPAAGDFTAGEALLEYFMSEHWVDVFVFQKDKPSTWHRIPNETELQGLIRQYLAYFENDFAILSDPDGYFQTAHALWQKLVPVETGSAALLTILPDGILNFVPFEALLTSDNAFAPKTWKEKPSLRTAAYLIRQKEVRYAWSLAVLRQQKNLKSKASNYLLSIAPGFANRERGLAPLTSTNFDWLGIDGWDNKNLKGQAADLQHFLKAASGYRVLHFSTHAFADGNPRIELMDSSLLLPDLYALPLQADLVMLSACQTGLGKEEKGEGVMSLARAFAQAGAACIVSSLWSVNDQSTSRLLRYFYEKIGQGHTSGAALREAKVAYLFDTEVGNAAQSPYFWAGLVAVGDDRVIEQPWGWGVWGILGAGMVVLLFVGWWFWRKRL